MPSSYQQNLPRSTADHYLHSADLGLAAASDAQQAWGKVNPDFVKESWADLSPQAMSSVQAARVEISLASIDTVTDTLDELGIDPAPATVQVDVRGLVATSSAGTLIEDVLDAAPIRTLSLVKDGTSIVDAMASTRKWIGQTAYDLVQEASGDASIVDTASRRQVTGYVRMLTPPSCARCAILAGRWYRWNDGFDRHPHCDCVHIPAAEYVAGDIRVDPKAYFDSLDKWDWDDLHLNTRDRAAIEAGANPITVINTRQRGSPIGKRRNSKKRLTIDEIYDQAGDNRDLALELLQRQGYLRMPQLGPRATFTEAATRRDLLNPDTMTAAERRLYNAWFRLDYMRRTGFQPSGIRASSADKSGFLVRASQRDIDDAADLLDRLSNHALTQRASKSLAELAQLLAIR